MALAAKRSLRDAHGALVVCAAMALASIAAALVGQALSAPDTRFATLWPPAGLYLAALLAFPRSRHLAIAIGAIVGNVAFNLLVDMSPAAAIVFAAANTVDAFAAAALLTRLIGPDRALVDSRAVLAFGITAMLTPALGATIGTLWLQASVGGDALLQWTTWWSAVVVGIVATAPIVLAALWPWMRRREGAGSMLEAALIALALALVAALTVQSLEEIPLPFFALPFLLWAAVRFGMFGAIVAACGFTFLAAYLDAARPLTSVSLALLQSQLAVLVLMTLLVAALLAERRAIERGLREAKDDLEQRVANRTAALSEALAQADARGRDLRRTADHTPDLIARYDTRLRLMFVNAEFERVIGRCAAEVLGRPDPDIGYPPQVRRAWLDALGHVRASGEPMTLETQFFGARFKTRLVPERAPDGRLESILAVSTDVTEIVRARESLSEQSNALALVNERFRTALATSSVVVFNQDRELRYTWIYNPALGKTADEVIGRSDHDLFERTRDAQATEEIKREVMASGRGWRGPVQVLHEGRTRHYELTVEPQRDPDGEVVGVICAAVDVTELNEATEAARASEARYRVLAEALREMDRRKDEFLAMLAHELRNPLAPIRNAVHILQRSALPSPALAHVRDVLARQSAHLVRMVDDLLDVSRVTTGKILLQRAPEDMRAIVEAGVETARENALAKGLCLAVDLPPAGSVTVHGDFARLTQVVGNLVANAVKFTPEGGRVEVVLRRVDGAIELAVSDSGVGIDARTLPHVFDLFVQADVTLARSAGGLGIGLALVRRLVELHGGRVSATSDGPGHGACFVVHLPEETSDLRAVGSAPGGAASTTVPARRVLVVDDNIDAAESIAMLLRMDGHVVSVAHDGESAIDAARRGHFEVILLDLGLPDLDGFTVAARLREAGCDAALIALTGYGQPEDRLRTRAAGFVAHLLKPVDPQALRERLAAPNARVDLAVAARIREPGLQRFFSAWQNLRAGEGLPALDALLAATESEADDRVIARIDSLAPFAVHIERLGARLAANLGDPTRPHAVASDAEIESGSQLAAYRRVALSGEPSHERAEYRFGVDDVAGFERVIVPASAEGSAQPTHLVAAVVFATQFTEEPI